MKEEEEKKGLFETKKNCDRVLTPPDFRLARERENFCCCCFQSSSLLLSLLLLSLSESSLLLLLERALEGKDRQTRTTRKEREKVASADPPPKKASEGCRQFEIFSMGACTSSPHVADDDDNLELGGLAPGPDHVLARFKNQDVATLATKYMPKDALTASVALSSTSTTTTMMMPAPAAPRLISSVPSPPSTFHHLPPLALGALGDNSLDDEPGARTVRPALSGATWEREKENFNRALLFFSVSPSLSFALF